LLAPLAAQSDKNWDICIAVDGAPARRLEACTAIIEAKSETSRRLAGAHCIRGHELTEKRELDEAIELNPNDTNAFDTRGTIHAKLGSRDEAAADFRKALDLNPELTASAEPLKKLGATR
jgi:Tfp pilus assembly protein PilF